MNKDLAKPLGLLLVWMAMVPVVVHATPPDPATEATEATKATEVTEANRIEGADGILSNTDAERAAREQETLGFRQATARAQMLELEERMFRLSESLQQMEPENSSKLRMALRYAREELIAQRMKEAEERLTQAQWDRAASDQRELLVRLTELENLLLQTELDFDQKLERLRQIKDSLQGVDRVIREEEALLDESRKLEEEQQKRGRLRKRQADLSDLVRRQKELLEETRRTAKPNEEAVFRALRKQQSTIRRDTQLLAETDASAEGSEQPKDSPGSGRSGGAGGPRDAEGASSPTSSPSPSSLEAGAGEGLAQAQAAMEQAMDAMDALDPQATLAKEQAALDALRSEEKVASARLRKASETAEEARLKQAKSDQARNRGLTDSLASSTSRLGRTGADAASDLISASRGMAGAEGSLGGGQPGSAAGDQEEALRLLRKSKRSLEDGAQKLRDELHPEVHARVLESLQEMLDRQTAIREATEKLVPVEGPDRTVRAKVLSKEEMDLSRTAEALAKLTAETDFGITLPTVLAVIAGGMSAIASDLDGGRADEFVVAAERRIEADLRTLLEAMQQMPNQPKPSPVSPPSESGPTPQDLDRILAELKMVRVLQNRVNQDTIEVDGRRPRNEEVLPRPLEEDIRAVGDSQQRVGEVMGRLATEVEKVGAGGGSRPAPEKPWYDLSP